MQILEIWFYINNLPVAIAIIRKMGKLQRLEGKRRILVWRAVYRRECTAWGEAILVLSVRAGIIQKEQASEAGWAWGGRGHAWGTQWWSWWTLGWQWFWDSAQWHGTLQQHEGFLRRRVVTGQAGGWGTLRLWAGWPGEVTPSSWENDDDDVPYGNLAWVGG